MYDPQAAVRIPFPDLDGRRDGCENHPKEDELGLLRRGARGSSLPPTPPRLHRLALCSWRSRATNNVENLRPGLWDGWDSIYKHRGRG